MRFLKERKLNLSFRQNLITYVMKMDWISSLSISYPFDNYTKGNPCQIINNAFNWMSTPQGQEVWRNTYNDVGTLWRKNIGTQFQNI